MNHVALTERREALAELERGLQRLLSLLDGEAPAAKTILRAVDDCDVRMAAVRRSPIPTDETDAEREAFRRSLEEALRLNAVARSVVESQAAELIRRLERARGLRRGLNASTTGAGSAGGSVDVAG